MSIHETLLVCCDENKDKHGHHKTRNKKVRWRDETEGPSSSSSSLVDDWMAGLESSMTKEEHFNTWYPSDELIAQRILARNVAAGVRKCEPSSDENSYGGVIERVYNSCLHGIGRGPSKKDVKLLELWTRVAHSRRGLERWSVPKSGEQRSETRKALVQEIVRFQHGIDPHLDVDEKAEMIRTRSRALSHASRRYATIMGQADAKAVRSEPFAAFQTRRGSI
jgi:hypothetical protein